MAATFASVTALGGDPSAPVYHDLVTMLGTNPYGAGVDYVATVLIQAKIGAGRTILDIRDQGDNATYYCQWNAATDRIVVYVRATGVEAGAVDLSAVTFKLLVISY